MQIPSESRHGQGQMVGGQKRIQLIAIDYHAATGTAGTCQGHSTPMLPVYYSAPSQGQLVQLAVLTG